jgi:hypothetical protein
MSSFVDSNTRKLSAEEIITIAAKEIGGKYTPEQIKASLSAEAYEMGGLMLQEGNTIFIIHPSAEMRGVGVFRALNADIMSNYVKNCLVFTKAVGLAGFKYIVTVFEEPSLLNIFKYVKRNQPFPGMGYAVQKTKDGQYKVTVNLGKTDTGGLPDQAVPQAPGAL